MTFLGRAITEAQEETRVAQTMWLYTHDILRDKSGQLTIQEAIDAVSEAYKLTTGKDIEDWLREKKG